MKNIFLCVKINIYYDDGIQHIARAYGTKESFENLLFPNIITSFTNGFGYSWNLFYGPLTPYAILFTSFLTGNFINAYKLITCICLILSGFTMYKFVNCLTKNNNASLLASILYMTFPYHLTDLYIRNAFGEFVSFIFIPLVFLGLYNLFYTSEKKNYDLTIGAVGLILTHNLSTVIVAFFALLFTVLNIEKLKETRVGKTNIIVAHCFSAIALADKIIVLQDGKITDIGTHHELLKYHTCLLIYQIHPLEYLLS